MNLPCIHVIVLDELFIIKSNTWAMVKCTCQSLVSTLLVISFNVFFMTICLVLLCRLNIIFHLNTLRRFQRAPFFGTSTTLPYLFTSVNFPVTTSSHAVLQISKLFYEIRNLRLTVEAALLFLNTGSS